MSTLPLPTELTIFTVDQLHPTWLAWLDEAGAAAPSMLKIDGRAVDEVDSAGLQLLVSLLRSLDDRGTPATLASPSAALCDAAERLGLSDRLGLAAATA